LRDRGQIGSGLRDNLDEGSMDEDEALRLNTLHRFRKHSPRLLLEEYSHCEVPAGCGGVVLRWIDRDAGTPALMRTVVEAQITAWIDGAQLDSGRVDLRAGVHTLALELTQIEPRTGPAPLLLAIVRTLPGDELDEEEGVVLLRSQVGRAWRVLGEQPPAGWTAIEFDDSQWPVAGPAELDAKQRESWRVQQIQRRGAVPIALPPERAWVRVRFEVAAFQPGSAGVTTAQPQEQS
jgi:hypothetical protein